MNDTQMERGDELHRINWREQQMAAEIERLQDENGILRREVVSVSLANERICAERNALRLDLVAARDLVSACEIPHMLAQMKQEFDCALELFARANKAKRQTRKDARQILKYAWHDETCNGDTMDCDCGLTKWTKKYGGANVK